MRTAAITIEEWCRLAAEGTKVPVEIKLAGASMEPLIRMNRDTVEIIPLCREPKEGDIVLFERQDGAYVVHRVYRVDAERIVTLGDHCENPDPPVPKEKVLGLVSRIRRGKKVIEADSERQRRHGRIGMKLLPLRKRWLHLKLVVKKNLGKQK